MNPAYPTHDYQDDAIPLHGGQHGVTPGQAQGSTVVQHTTVVIDNEPPKDYIVCSLFWLVYGNPLCLGLAALFFSIKARDRKMVQDMSGAREYASTARCLNIAATILVSLIVFITIIVVITQAATAAHHASSYSRYPY